MTVQAFGLLTAKNVNMNRRNQGIGAQYRSQVTYDAEISRALGLGQKRVGVGSRFKQDPNFYNRYNYATASGSSRSSFNWGGAAAGGVSMAATGAMAGWQMSGGNWIGAVVGGAVGLIGGACAGGFSG